MATIIGTAASDVMTGTTDADRIEGGAGNDRINGGAGDDEILGGLGTDILTGDAGNDRIFGEDGGDGIYGGGGNDLIDGGAGNDNIFGDGGNDTIIGGTGNDTLNGGTGDDTFIWRSGDGSDTIIGGGGNDTLTLELSSGDITPALRAELAAYQSWAAQQLAQAGSSANLSAQTTGATFTFASLGLTLSVIEGLGLKVDGQQTAIQSLLNQAPVAAASVALETAEDSALVGTIAATDADGDALTFVLDTAPANGSITLDASTGAFVYTPAVNVSGADSFVVRITDPSGATTTQTVNVSIAAVADAPNVTASNATVTVARPVVGTDADEVISGDTMPDSVTMALDITSALTDVDGSESLSITISGVPAGAALSAGVKQPDGSWLLSTADLAGLSLTTPVTSDYALTVTAIATEQNGSVSQTSAEMMVSFDLTGVGNDVIDGAGGNDILDGGLGNDVLIGGAGNDVLIHRGTGDVAAFAAFSAAAQDQFSGGEGHDVVRLILSAADVTPTFLADLANCQAWMSAGGNGSFVFGSLGLTVDSVEELSISVDGRDISISELLNTAPVAESAVVVAAIEDAALHGVIAATDAEGGALAFTIENGPAMGSVSIDPATGAFVYTPAANVSGSDSFTVRVTDPFGASVVQTVNIGIEARADAPQLTVQNTTVSVARLAPATGTAGADVIRGDQYAATATAALSIAAALTDLDGSETLAIRVRGVPVGATLSAGTLQSDGSWLLQPADLQGLTMTASTASTITLQVTAIAQDGSSVAETTGSIRVAFSRTGSLNDTIVATTGNDTYDGGNGTDTVSYADITTAVTVDLANGVASGPGNQTLTAIENVTGTSGNDILSGNGSANVLNGGDGDDEVNGGLGNDNLTGVAGDDILIGGAGNDRVSGGDGNDTIIGGQGNDTYAGGAGYDVLDYSEATSAIAVNNGRVTGMGSDRYSSIEKVVGSDFNDSFSGGRNVDTFDGGAGNDTFRGFEGSDIFTGGAGADRFVWLERDVVSGKKSQGVDTITDFSVGDTLDVSAITSNASQVKVTDTAAGSIVSVQVGSAFYDVVLLQGVHGVSANSLLSSGQLIA